MPRQDTTTGRRRKFMAAMDGKVERTITGASDIAGDRVEVEISDWNPHGGIRHPAEPRAPAPDHLVLCAIDCARPLANCHCLRGMLADRGLVAMQYGIDLARPDWRPPHPPAPDTIISGPDDSTSLAPLLIALTLGLSAAVSFAIAWWLA